MKCQKEVMKWGQLTRLKSIVPGKFSQCYDEGDIFFICLFLIATRRTLPTILLTTIQENDNNENDNNTNY